MDDLRIALLNASHPADGEQSGSRAAALTRRNFRRELDADLVEFEVVGGGLADVDDVDADAVVVSGSRASVYWDDPWISALTGWVGDAVDRGLPTLGVCYGHQVVAHALGGTVEPAGEYELGYVTIERAGDSPLLSGLPDRFTAFASHSDAVVELPPGAELIAENDFGVQGFQRDDAFGVQFHPEYDMETARIVAERKDLPEERIRRVVEGITAETYAEACRTKQLFDNFAEYARSVRPPASG